MNRNGFTLLELLISTSILAIVGLLSMVAVQSSAASMSVASTKAQVMEELRDTMGTISQQLQLAAKEGDESMDPILEEVSITRNPVGGSPVEIAFQVPVDDTGRSWSRRISMRFMDEDLNDNSILDPGEDVDEDGMLTRRIVRIEDRNGDKNIDSDKEVTTVGAANNISDVQFTRDGDVVTITLSASKLLPGKRTNPISASLTGRVYLLN